MSLWNAARLYHWGGLMALIDSLVDRAKGPCLQVLKDSGLAPAQIEGGGRLVGQGAVGEQAQTEDQEAPARKRAAHLADSQ